MNVASLDLCQELAKLSGWNDTVKVWSNRVYGGQAGTTVARAGSALTDTRKTTARKWFVVSRNKRQTEAFPAYDAGYLLRKLPDNMKDKGHLHVGKWGHSYWRAGYLDFEPGWTDLRAFADTPEDALCLLAIDLFKQGVLK